jgi:hypothetical protein
MFSNFLKFGLFSKAIAFAGIVSLSMALTGCPDDCNCPDTSDGAQIEGNGLSKDINDIVPQDILDEMEELGFEINGGGNPPNIEGTYYGDSFTLESSNIPEDEPGNTFTNYYLRMSKQDMDDLTILFEQWSTTQSGEAQGAYVVGEGDEFSIFVEMKSYDSYYNDSSYSVQTFSGKVTSAGIENLQLALFMLDDYGDPNDQYISIGQGRIIYEADGLAERTSTTMIPLNLPVNEMLKDKPSVLKSK